MRDPNQVEYRHSFTFWLKKIALLVFIFLLGWLMWWLWQWDPNNDNEDSSNNQVAVGDIDNDGIDDDEDTDKDGDGYSNEDEEKAGSDPESADSTPDAQDKRDTDGDGFTDDEEREKGSDLNDKESTPDNVDNNIPVVYGASGAQFAVNLPVGYKHIEQEGCVQTFEKDAGEEGVTTILVALDCAVGAPAHDFAEAWTHSVSADGDVTLASNNSQFCDRSTNTNCSSGNGVLEINSQSTGDEGLFISIKDTTGVDETNAVAEFQPLIESIKVKR